jgi:putative tryptophan/tyrosine transport system substrate-binding protein
MKRREFITALGGAAVWPLAAQAQQSKKIYRIGYLTANLSSYPWVNGFVRELSDRGYSEGNNLTIEWREAKGHSELLPGMAADLVRQNVDVIVAVGNYPGLLVQKITATIPIVVLSSRGGVETKLYSSLSHPGGNLTGIDNLSPARDVKRVEFLKEIVPKLSRLAVLYNPLPSYASNHLNSISLGFEKLEIEAQPFEVRSPPEFEVAFASILRKRQDTMIDAMTTVTDPMFVFDRKRIVDFGIENKIPNAHEYREWVQIGGLLAYGPTIDGIWRRGAYFVEKILNGAKPSDLPVEGPSEFHLAINLKAAKDMGLSVPQHLVARADELIKADLR